MFIACTGSDPAPPEPDQSKAAPKPEPARCPLTGEPPPHDIDLDRPAVAVKIENSPQARPQHGLENADIVFEEIVEGGITRFMAIYHCGSSKDAGPVRSARFDDPKIARPFTRVIAFSGSNGLVNKELEKRNMIILNEINQQGAFFRVPPGVLLVHNLFVRTEVLRNDKRVRKVDPPLADVFTFGDVPKGATRARRVRVNFNASITIEYRYREGAWKRFEDGPFMTARGSQIAVPNVLIQEVGVHNSSRLRDSAGNPSPKIDLKGKGRAFLFRDGRVIKGTWQMKNGRPYYRTRSGKDFVFAPGSIWIELVPSKKGEVKGAIAFD
jgi:hypothetical protein